MPTQSARTDTLFEVSGEALGEEETEDRPRKRKTKRAGVSNVICLTKDTYMFDGRATQIFEAETNP